jgi:hypothetical protein
MNSTLAVYAPESTDEVTFQQSLGCTEIVPVSSRIAGAATPPQPPEGRYF